jgi:CRP/FNR family cyclic AMP-dependent transcriptional regulator
MICSASAGIEPDPAPMCSDAAFAFLQPVGTLRPFSPDGGGSVIFAQGDPATEVYHLRSGTVRKSVLARDGREVIVDILGPGDFFGEECLAGRSFRASTACALSEGTVLVVKKDQMVHLLHRCAPLADWFLSRTLARLTRIEDDLADQRTNPSEKRLARILLSLARHGRKDEEHCVLPILSQATLAAMVGTTRSRVNVFMNRFKRQGLVDYNECTLTIKRGLRRIVEEEGEVGRPLATETMQPRSVAL